MDAAATHTQELPLCHGSPPASHHPGAGPGPREADAGHRITCFLFFAKMQKSTGLPCIHRVSCDPAMPAYPIRDSERLLLCFLSLSLVIVFGILFVSAVNRLEFSMIRITSLS